MSKNAFRFRRFFVAFAVLGVFSLTILPMFTSYSNIAHGDVIPEEVAQKLKLKYGPDGYFSEMGAKENPTCPTYDPSTYDPNNIEHFPQVMIPVLDDEGNPEIDPGTGQPKERVSYGVSSQETGVINQNGSSGTTKPTNFIGNTPKNINANDRILFGKGSSTPKGNDYWDKGGDKNVSSSEKLKEAGNIVGGANSDASKPMWRVVAVGCIPAYKTASSTNFRGGESITTNVGNHEVLLVTDNVLTDLDSATPIPTSLPYSFTELDSRVRVNDLNLKQLYSPNSGTNTIMSKIGNLESQINCSDLGDCSHATNSWDQNTFPSLRAFYDSTGPNDPNNPNFGLDFSEGGFNSTEYFSDIELQAPVNTNWLGVCKGNNATNYQKYINDLLAENNDQFGTSLKNDVQYYTGCAETAVGNPYLIDLRNSVGYLSSVGDLPNNNGAIVNIVPQGDDYYASGQNGVGITTNSHKFMPLSWADVAGNPDNSKSTDPLATPTTLGRYFNASGTVGANGLISDGSATGTFTRSGSETMAYTGEGAKYGVNITVNNPDSGVYSATANSTIRPTFKLDLDKLILSTSDADTHKLQNFPDTPSSTPNIEVDKDYTLTIVNNSVLGLQAAIADNNGDSDTQTVPNTKKDLGEISPTDGLISLTAISLPAGFDHLGYKLVDTNSQEVVDSGTADVSGGTASIPVKEVNTNYDLWVWAQKDGQCVDDTDQMGCSNEASEPLVWNFHSTTKFFKECQTYFNVSDEGGNNVDIKGYGDSSDAVMCEEGGTLVFGKNAAGKSYTITSTNSNHAIRVESGGETTLNFTDDADISPLLQGSGNAAQNNLVEMNRAGILVRGQGTKLVLNVSKEKTLTVNATDLSPTAICNMAKLVGQTADPSNCDVRTSSKTSAMILSGRFFPSGGAGIQVMNEANLVITGTAEVGANGLINRGKVIAKGSKGGAGIGLPGTYYDDKVQSVQYNYYYDNLTPNHKNANMKRVADYYPTYAKDLDVIKNGDVQQKLSVAKAGKITIQGQVEVDAQGSSFGSVTQSTSSTFNGITTGYGSSAAGIGGGACFNATSYTQQNYEDPSYLSKRRSHYFLMDGTAAGPVTNFDSNDIPYWELPVSGSHSEITITGESIVKTTSEDLTADANSSTSATGAGLGTGAGYMCSAPSILSDRYGNKDTSATINGNRIYNAELGAVRPFGQLGAQEIVGRINIEGSASLDAHSKEGFATGAGIGGGSVILEAAPNGYDKGNGPHRIAYAGDAGSIDISTTKQVKGISGSGVYVGAGIGGGAIKNDASEGDLQISASYEPDTNVSMSVLDMNESSRFAGISASLNITGNLAPTVIAYSGAATKLSSDSGEKSVAIGAGVTNSIDKTGYGNVAPDTLGFFNKFLMTNGTVIAIGNKNVQESSGIGGGKLIYSDAVKSIKSVGDQDGYKPVQVNGGSLYTIGRSAGQNIQPSVKFVDPSLYPSNSLQFPYGDNDSSGLRCSSYTDLSDCANKINSNVYNNTKRVYQNIVHWVEQNSSGIYDNPNPVYNPDGTLVAGAKFKDTNPFKYTGSLQTGCDSSQLSVTNYKCPLYDFYIVNGVSSQPFATTDAPTNSTLNIFDTSKFLNATYDFDPAKPNGVFYPQIIFPWLSEPKTSPVNESGITANDEQLHTAANNSTSYGQNHDNFTTKIMLYQDKSRATFAGGFQAQVTEQTLNYHDQKPRYNQTMTLKAKVGGKLDASDQNSLNAGDPNTIANVRSMNLDGRRTDQGVCSDYESPTEAECVSNSSTWTSPADIHPVWECKWFLATNQNGAGATQIASSVGAYYPAAKVSSGVYDCSDLGRFETWEASSHVEQYYNIVRGISFTPRLEDVGKYLQLQVKLKSDRHFDREFTVPWDATNGSTWIEIQAAQLGSPSFTGGRYTGDTGQARDIVERNICDMAPTSTPFGTIPAAPNEWSARDWSGTTKDSNYTYNGDSFIGKQVCAPFGLIELKDQDGDHYTGALDYQNSPENGGNATISWKRIDKITYDGYVSSQTLNQASGTGNDIATAQATFQNNGWLIKPTNALADNYIQATITITKDGYGDEIFYTDWIRVWSYTSLNTEPLRSQQKADDGWLRGCSYATGSSVSNPGKPINSVIAIGGGCDNNLEGHENLHSPSAPNYYWTGGGKYNFPDSFGTKLSGGFENDGNLRYGETITIKPNNDGADLPNENIKENTRKIINIMTSEYAEYPDTGYTCSWRWYAQSVKPTIAPNSPVVSESNHLKIDHENYDNFPEGDGQFSGNSNTLSTDAKCRIDDNGFVVTPTYQTPFNQANYASSPKQYAWVALVIEFHSELYNSTTLTAMPWTPILEGKIKKPKFGLLATDITADNNDNDLMSGTIGAGFPVECNLAPSSTSPEITHTKNDAAHRWKNLCLPFGPMSKDTGEGYDAYDFSALYNANNPVPDANGVTKELEYRSSTSGSGLWAAGSVANTPMGISSTGDRWTIAPTMNMADKYFNVKFTVKKLGYESVSVESGWIKVYSQALLNNPNYGGLAPTVTNAVGDGYYLGCNASIENHSSDGVKQLVNTADGRQRKVALGGGCRVYNKGKNSIPDETQGSWAQSTDSSSTSDSVDNLKNLFSTNYYWPGGGPATIPSYPLVGKVTEPAGSSASTPIKYDTPVKLGLLHDYSQSQGDPLEYSNSKTVFDELKNIVVTQQKGHITCKWRYSTYSNGGTSPIVLSPATTQSYFQTYLKSDGTAGTGVDDGVNNNCDGLLYDGSLTVDPSYVGANKYISLIISFASIDGSFIDRDIQVLGWGAASYSPGLNSWTKINKASLGTPTFASPAKDVVATNYCDVTPEDSPSHPVPNWSQDYSTDYSKQVCTPFGRLTVPVLTGGGKYVGETITNAQIADKESFRATAEWRWADGNNGGVDEPSSSATETLLQITSANGGLQGDVAANESTWKLTPRASLAGKWIRARVTVQKGDNYESIQFYSPWVKVFSIDALQENNSGILGADYYYGCDVPVSQNRNDGRPNVGTNTIALGALGGGCNNNPSSGDYNNQRNPNSPNYWWRFGGPYNYKSSLIVKSSSANTVVDSQNTLTLDSKAPSDPSSTPDQVNTYYNSNVLGNTYECKWYFAVSGAADQQITDAPTNYPENCDLQTGLAFTPRPEDVGKTLKLKVTLTNSNKITQTVVNQQYDSYNSKTFDVFSVVIQKASLGKLFLDQEAEGFITGVTCNTTFGYTKTASDLCTPMSQVKLADHPDWVLGQDFQIVTKGSVSATEYPNLKDQLDRSTSESVNGPTLLGWKYLGPSATISQSSNPKGFLVSNTMECNGSTVSYASVTSTDNPYFVTPNNCIGDYYLSFTFMAIKQGYNATVYVTDYANGKIIKQDNLIEGGTQEYLGCDIVPYIANNAVITFSGTPAINAPGKKISDLTTQEKNAVNTALASSTDKSKVTVTNPGSASGASCDNDGDGIPNAHDPDKPPQYDWEGGGPYLFPDTFKSKITASGTADAMNKVPTVGQPLVIKADASLLDAVDVNGKTDIANYGKIITKANETGTVKGFPVPFASLPNTTVTCIWRKSSASPGSSDTVYLANSTVVNDNVNFPSDCYSALTAGTLSVTPDASWINPENSQGFSIGLQLQFANDLFTTKQLLSLSWTQVKKAQFGTTEGGSPIVTLASQAQDIVFSSYKDSNPGELCNLTPGHISNSWRKPTSITSEADLPTFTGGGHESLDDTHQLCKPFGALIFQQGYTGPQEITQNSTGLTVQARWQVISTLNNTGLEANQKYKLRAQLPDNDLPFSNINDSIVKADIIGPSNSYLNFRDTVYKLKIQPTANIRGGYIRAEFTISLPGYDSISVLSSWIYVYDYTDLNGTIDENTQQLIPGDFFYEGCTPPTPNPDGKGKGVGAGLGGGCDNTNTTVGGIDVMNREDFEVPNYWWAGGGPGKGLFDGYDAKAEPDSLVYGQNTKIVPDLDSARTVSTMAAWNEATSSKKLECYWEQNLKDPNDPDFDISWQSFTAVPSPQYGFYPTNCDNLLSSDVNDELEGITISPGSNQVSAAILPSMRLQLKLFDHPKYADYDSSQDIPIWQGRVSRGKGSGAFKQQVKNLIHGAVCDTTPKVNPQSTWHWDSNMGQSSGQICSPFGTLEINGFPDGSTQNLQWNATFNPNEVTGGGEVLAQNGTFNNYFDWSQTQPTGWKLLPKDESDTAGGKVWVQMKVTVSRVGFETLEIYSDWIPVMDYSINDPTSPNYTAECKIHTPIPDNAKISYTDASSNTVTKHINELTDDELAYLNTVVDAQSGATNWDSITIDEPGFAIGGKCDNDGDGDPNANDDDEFNYRVPGGGPYSFFDGFKIKAVSGGYENDKKLRYDQTIKLMANFDDTNTESNILLPDTRYKCQVEYSNDPNIATSNPNVDPHSDVVDASHQIVKIDSTKCADLVDPTKGLDLQVINPSTEADRYVRILVTLYDDQDKYEEKVNILSWNGDTNNPSVNSEFGWKKIEKGIFGTPTMTDADWLVQQQKCDTFPGNGPYIYQQSGDQFCQPFGALQFASGFGTSYGTPLQPSEFKNVHWLWAMDNQGSGSAGVTSTLMTVSDSNKFDIIPSASLASKYIQANFYLERVNYLNSVDIASGWMKVFSYKDINSPSGDDKEEGCVVLPPIPDDSVIKINGIEYYMYQLTPSQLADLKNMTQVQVNSMIVKYGNALGGYCNNDDNPELNVDQPGTPNYDLPKGDQVDRKFFDPNFRLKVVKQDKETLYEADKELHVDNSLYIAADQGLGVDPTSGDPIGDSDQQSTYNMLHISGLQIECRIDYRRTDGVIQNGTYQICSSGEKNIIDDTKGIVITPNASSLGQMARIVIRVSAPGYVEKVFGDEGTPFSSNGFSDWHEVFKAKFGDIYFASYASDIFNTIRCDFTPGREVAESINGIYNSETCTPFGKFVSPDYPNLYLPGTNTIDGNLTQTVNWKWSRSSTGSNPSSLTTNQGTVTDKFIIALSSGTTGFLSPEIIFAQPGYENQTVTLTYTQRSLNKFLDSFNSDDKVNNPWIKILSVNDGFNDENDGDKFFRGCEIHPTLPNNTFIASPTVNNGQPVMIADLIQSDIDRLDALTPPWGNITIIRNGNAIGGGCDDDYDGIINKEDEDDPTSGIPGGSHANKEFSDNILGKIERHSTSGISNDDQGLYVGDTSYIVVNTDDENTRNFLAQINEILSSGNTPTLNCFWYTRPFSSSTAGISEINDPSAYPTDPDTCKKILDVGLDSGIPITPRPGDLGQAISLEIEVSAPHYETKRYSGFDSTRQGVFISDVEEPENVASAKFLKQPEYLWATYSCDTKPGRTETPRDTACTNKRNIFGNIEFEPAYTGAFDFKDIKWFYSATNSSMVGNTGQELKGANGSYKGWVITPGASLVGKYVRVQTDFTTADGTKVGRLISRWIEVRAVESSLFGPDGENPYEGCEDDHSKPGLGALCDDDSDGIPNWDDPDHAYCKNASPSRPAANEFGVCPPPAVAPTEKKPPTAPMNLKITTKDNALKQKGTDVIVTWTAPIDNGGSPIKEYKVTMKDAFGMLWPVNSLKAGASDKNGYVDNVSVGTKLTYTYTGGQIGKYVVTVTPYNAQGAGTPVTGSEIVTLAEETEAAVKKKGINFTDTAAVKKNQKERYNDIMWMAKTNVTIGSYCVPKEKGKKCIYNPNGAVTRAAMGDFMYKLLGQPDRGVLTTQEKWFKKDKATVALKGTVQGGIKNWRYNNVLWLAKKGITKGSSYDSKGVPNAFNPSGPVVRGAMAEFMYHLANDPQSMNRFFEDENNINDNHIDWTDKNVLPTKFKNFFKVDKQVQGLNNPKFNAKKIVLKGAVTGKVTYTPTRYGDIHWLARNGITLGNVKPGTAIPTGIYNNFGVTNRGAMAQFMHKLYWTILTGKPVPADNLIPDNATIRKCAVGGICPKLTS